MKFLKLTFSIATLAILGTACKKDAVQPETKLQLQNTKASVPVGSTRTVVLTSSSTSSISFTAVGYDFYDNVVSNVSNHVNFENNFNGNITTLNGYNLGYYDSPTVSDVTNITLADISDVYLGSISTLGQINAPSGTQNIGWYLFNWATYTIEPLAKRYAIVGDGTTISGSTEVYAVQLNSVTVSGNPVNGYISALNIHYKRLK